LLPSWFQGNNNTLPTNNTTQLGYGIKLVISRNSDGSYIVLNPSYVISGYVYTLNSIALVPTIIYSATIYTDSSLYSYPTYNQFINYSTGSVYASPMLSLLSDRTTLVKNDNILVGGNTILGNLSGVQYTLNLSATDSRKYRTWSSGDNHIWFNSNTVMNTTLLLLDE
jgi:hypothetical protein